MSRNLLYLALLTITAQAITACMPFTPGSPPGAEVKLQFVNYIQSGLPEQDVFIEPDETTTVIVSPQDRCKSGNDVDPNFIPSWMRPPDLWNPCATNSNVVRAEPKEAQHPTFLAKQLYAAREVIPHDLHRSGLNSLGPFPKGDALGVTLGEWLAARGNGMYSVKDGNAEFTLSFQKLIPHGRYSLWCGRETPTKDTLFEAPCGNADGSEYQVSADEWGNARLSFQLKPLQASTWDETTILSLTYDRLVPTKDGELGGSGLNNHVQLWFAFPVVPSEIEPPAQPKS